MPSYNAPIRDMQFVLHEVLNSSALSAYDGLEDLTPDVIDAILEEANKICREALLPLNRSGDEEGCTFENGAVRTPAGFKKAYETFREGGWVGLACDPAYGGQGLPKSINVMVEEMICATNLSFGMYPGLSFGAYAALHAHGSAAQKDLYLPKLVSGEWSGTMCLTEPHCGTDLGLINTKAIPNGDESYCITGTKIFISAGEHDLTDNIIHLVLAKLPDAPDSVKGISLFVVPKFLPDEDGNPGMRNGVHCGAIEHKMGIKASATCVMNFDGATGWLVGQPNKGMQAMFTMMNQERISVGMQGLGLGEAAYQGAVEYAKERIQGRALTGAKATDKKADPIIVHPDIRRSLLTMRAHAEGCRLLGGWVAERLDESQHHPDPEKRQKADDFVALMTPIVKALFTDLGYDNTNIGMQVYGGHGYIREWGMEQLVRDCRIAQIYEGTNGIQALDLVGRKMPAHMGRFLRQFFHPVQDYIEKGLENSEQQLYVGALAKAFGRLQQVTAHVAGEAMKNPDEAGAAATEYLRMFGLVAMGYMFCRAIDVVRDKIEDDDTGFYEAKMITARFFLERILPQTGALMAQIMSGSGTMMSMPEDLF